VRLLAHLPQRQQVDGEVPELVVVLGAGFPAEGEYGLLRLPSAHSPLPDVLHPAIRSRDRVQGEAAVPAYTTRQI